MSATPEKGKKLTELVEKWRDEVHPHYGVRLECAEQLAAALPPEDTGAPAEQQLNRIDDRNAQVDSMQPSEQAQSDVRALKPPIVDFDPTVSNPTGGLESESHIPLFGEYLYRTASAEQAQRAQDGPEKGNTPYLGPSGKGPVSILEDWRTWAEPAPSAEEVGMCSHESSDVAAPQDDATRRALSFDEVRDALCKSIDGGSLQSACPQLHVEDLVENLNVALAQPPAARKEGE